MRHLSFCIFLFITTGVFSQNTSEELIIEAIRTQNIALLETYLDSSNIDNNFSDNKGNALFHAIHFNAPKSVRFLLKKGAKPNYQFYSSLPLISAVDGQKVSMVRLLLKYGAYVNAKDSAGNSVLMIASAKTNLKIIKLLVKNGAFLNYRNKSGYTARDFAIRSTNKAIAEYLRRHFENNLPNYSDGPYLRFRNKNKIEARYIKHDSLNRRTFIEKQIYKLKDINHRFVGLSSDTSSYPISLKFENSISEYRDVKKLLVIGDIHGQFDTLKTFLINNRVVDSKMHWIFGKGTIVFMGDIFDRGEKVTEALWLIYKLEHEAALCGGKVHLILGNHELLVFQQDHKYLAEKYYYMFNRLKLNYSHFYGKNSVLGQWLRSKNAIIKIDSFLFVHGGIHPYLIKYKLSIDTINTLLKNYINNPGKLKFSNDKVIQFLIGYNGPLWYRGMVDQSGEDKFEENDLKNILEFYNVSSVLVGHTYNSEIKFFNNCKIVATDVPFYLNDGYPMQALLFEDHKLVILNSQGEKKQVSFSNNE